MDWQLALILGAVWLLAAWILWDVIAPLLENHDDE